MGPSFGPEPHCQLPGAEGLRVVTRLQ
eukprot:SAG11_NODE_36295_length_262_cov_0.920245_1_plen_26_part_10